MYITTLIVFEINSTTGTIYIYSSKSKIILPPFAYNVLVAYYRLYFCCIAV